MQARTVSLSIPEGAVLFLFNHDATHQLAHTAGILRAVAEKRPGFPIICACGTPAIAEGVRSILGDAAASRIGWFDLTLPQTGTVTRLLNRIAPAERLARLNHHAAELKKAALIISPERTCLHLKRKWQGKGPQFLFVPHGAGDRSVTYHRDMAGFDAMLVSGQKVADEMLRHGLARKGAITIIGYPKFDLIDLDRRHRFFDDDRPVFLYNPHFDPYLSSWYDHGHAILNWFAFGPGREFNLIFAPHIMLFRKKAHISLEYRRMRRRPGLDPRWNGLPNIRIDVDSPRLSDMSYTLGSDVYIGDVSSQVYEFLYRPRPAFFIDTHSGRSTGDPAYLSWRAGDVVRSAEELFMLLPAFRERGAHYRRVQEEIFDYTMSRAEESSSERGARAIMTWLETGRIGTGTK